MLGAKPVSHFQRHRLPRYSVEGFKDASLKLELLGHQTTEAELLNFSKKGLAFKVNARLISQPLEPLSRISSIQFAAFGKTFFEGPVEVRHCRLEEGNYTVGVFIQDQSIKVEQLLGLKIGYQIINGQNGFNTIPRAFKLSEEFQLLVNQYRDYLLSIKEALEKTEKEIEILSLDEKEETERTVLLELTPSFVEKSDFYLKKISAICRNFEDKEKMAYKYYFQSHLHDLIMLCPFMHRCVTKPLGYAGDYDIMNMIYDDDRYRGTSLFAKLENFYWSSISTARATKTRMKYVKSKIEELILKKAKEGKKVKITSLGCGPSKEIYEFIQESELSNHCIFTCVDLDSQALDFSRQTLTEVIEKNKRTTGLNRVLANVVSYLRSTPQDFMFEQDFIYAAGLYDYLKPSIAKKLTESLFSLVKPGGELVLMNVSTHNPGRIKVEFGAEWFLVHRTEEEMLELISDINDVSDKKFSLDSENVYWYLTLKK